MKRLLWAPLFLILVSCSSTKPVKECAELKQGLAIVRERLISGTSLVKLDINTNPLSDALAITKVTPSASKGCPEVVAGSQKILEMIRILRETWAVDPYKISERRNEKIWFATQIIPLVDKFNDLAGGANNAITGPGPALPWSDMGEYGYDYEIREWKGGLLGCMDPCGNYVVKSPKQRMFNVISQTLDAVIQGKEVEWPKGPEQQIIEEVENLENESE